jgi:hypothetical protein
LKPEELRTVVTALRELGLSREETANLLKGITKDVHALTPIWGRLGGISQKKSQLIKLGVALIAFPVPTIGIKKSLGAMLIAAGMVQERMKHLHAADVYGTFQDVYSELQKLQQQ